MKRKADQETQGVVAKKECVVKRGSLFAGLGSDVLKHMMQFLLTKPSGAMTFTEFRQDVVEVGLIRSTCKWWSVQINRQVSVKLLSDVAAEMNCPGRVKELRLRPEPIPFTALKNAATSEQWQEAGRDLTAEFKSWMDLMPRDLKASDQVPLCTFHERINVQGGPNIAPNKFANMDKYKIKKGKVHSICLGPAIWRAMTIYGSFAKAILDEAERVSKAAAAREKTKKKCQAKMRALLVSRNIPLAEAENTNVFQTRLDFSVQHMLDYYFEAIVKEIAEERNPVAFSTLKDAQRMVRLLSHFYSPQDVQLYQSIETLRSAMEQETKVDGNAIRDPIILKEIVYNLAQVAQEAKILNARWMNEHPNHNIALCFGCCMNDAGSISVSAVLSEADAASSPVRRHAAVFDGFMDLTGI